MAAVILGVVGASAAYAEQPPAANDLPRIDKPGQWRTMTQDDATTTSKCVARLVTPLCAVETVRACFVRQSDLLCGIAEGKDGPAGLLSRTKPVPGLTEKYRITGARVLRDQDIPSQHRNDGKWSWQAGDVLIDLIRRRCYDGKCQKPIKEKPPTTYVVRRVVDRWVVVDWDTPRW